MSRRYYIKGEVADGDFTSDLMSSGFSKAELASIIFFSDEYKTIATPTAGAVVFTLTPDDVHYKTVENGTFDAKDSYDGNRKAPNAANLAIRANVNLNGVTGATHFLATIWRA